MSLQVTLCLCISCRPDVEHAGVSLLRAAMADAGLGASVRIVPQACFSACKAPVSLSLQGNGRATYLFSGVDPERDLGDIVATVRTYLSAPDGWIEDARPCGRLRHCLLGRVPAFERSVTDGV